MIIVDKSPVEELDAEKYYESWKVYAETTQTQHEYLLERFDDYMYWRALTDDPTVMKYSHPKNYTGYQQRCFLVFWALWACRRGGLAMDIGSAGVKMCWTVDTDLYRGEHQQYYDGPCHPSIVMNANDLSMWENNTFSLVCANHVVEHLSQNLHKIWRNEWLRVLKPGGYIAIVTPDNRYCDVLGIDHDHRSAWTPDDFKQFVINPLRDVLDVIELDTFHNDFSFNFVGRKK